MVIRKKLNTKHTLIKTECFPHMNKNTKHHKKHRVLLGIGGNIGDVLRRFEHLFWYLKRSTLVHVLKTTPIVKNPAFGYVAQQDFYNSIVVVQTDLTPRALLRYVQSVEKKFGRKRLFKDGPRTLDIDILFYENISMQTNTLTIPHPHWQERASVLIPLRYI